jgi:hypothetical protein
MLLCTISIESLSRHNSRTFLCVGICGGLSFEVRLDQGDTRGVKTGRGVRKGCSLSPILINLYSEHLTKKLLEVFGDFRMRGQVIRTVKYADDLVLLAKEETLLQACLTV